MTDKPYCVRVLFDTDLILHALLGEHVPPHPVLTALDLARQGRIYAYVCAGSLLMIHEELDRVKTPPAARQRLQELLACVHVAPVDGQVLDMAMALDGVPFEAALTMATAADSGLDLVVTLAPEEYPEGEAVALDRFLDRFLAGV